MARDQCYVVVDMEELGRLHDASMSNLRFAKRQQENESR